MKAYKNILGAAMAAMTLASCSDDTQSSLNGEGTVSFSIDINNDVKPTSRGSVSSSQNTLKAELGDSFMFWISRTGSANDGLIATYEGLDNLPTSIKLNTGNYVAEAWAGDSLSASYDKRWFKGRMPFAITAGDNTPVAVTCKIANVVVSVEYGEGVLDAYDIDSLYICHRRGSLVFKPGEDQPTRGYFMMPSNDKDLAWTFVGTRKADGTVRTFSGTLKEVKPAYEYKFSVTFTPNNPEDTQVGGALFNIEVVHTETPVYDTQTIYCAPVLDGYWQGNKFDLEESINTTSKPGRVQVYVTSTSDIKSMQLSCDEFPTLLGIGNTVFDIISLTNSGVIGTINNSGLSWTRSANASAESYNIMLTLAAELTEAMEWEKLYQINIAVTDENGLSTTKTLAIKKTQAPIATPASVTDPNSLDASQISATSYTVTGEILKDSGEDVYIDYDSATSRASQRVKATVTGSTYTAKLTSLTPGTSYQYTVTYGSYVSDPVTFVTETGYQLPNSSFEEWNTSSSPYLIGPFDGSGASSFWDSGNHGSSTLKKNVTIPDTEVKHSGNQSVKLESQFVGVGSLGKFAAGNLFIGKYLKTDGTDGVIGFGRPFTGRPTKLRLWVRYVPAEITYGSDVAPEAAKGQMDRGFLYTALLDATTDSEYPEYPVVVKTKTQQFFNKDGANVIAYGDYEFTDNTGTTMIQIEVPFEYKRENIRPTYLMLTIAASKFGDYFAGGPSNMWIDDVELVYE